MMVYDLYDGLVIHFIRYDEHGVRYHHHHHHHLVLSPSDIIKKIKALCEDGA